MTTKEQAELKAKVGALKIPDGDMVKAITKRVYDEWDKRNKIIDKVLKIIDSISEETEGEWLDKPTEVGWWCIKLPDGDISYIELNYYEGELVLLNDCGEGDGIELMYASDFDGKWQKIGPARK